MNSETDPLKKLLSPSPELRERIEGEIRHEVKVTQKRNKRSVTLMLIPGIPLLVILFIVVPALGPLEITNTYLVGGAVFLLALGACAAFIIAQFRP